MNIICTFEAITDPVIPMTKKIPIFLYIVIMAVLAVATLMEWRFGTPFIKDHIYRQWWFVILWSLLFLYIILLIIKLKLYSRISVFFIHLSFLFILGGGFLTFLTGKSSTLHLRQQQSVNYGINTDKNTKLVLPFDIILESFEIEYYPGTNTPADYISHISIEGTKKVRMTVSMNRIGSYQGYRLYQNSYDRDLQGSNLTVKYDPWGIGITYFGYLLFFIGIVFYFFSPKSNFRKLLRHPLLKISLIAIPISVCGCGKTYGSGTLPGDMANDFGEILIYHNGRIMPLQTYAKDFTLKLSGKNHYLDFSPEQVLAGWIFYPREWQQEPMIKVKNKSLRTQYQWGKNIALSDLFDESGRYKFTSQTNSSGNQGKVSPVLKSIGEINEKVELIMMLQSGIPLKIFPVMEGGFIRWYSPADSLPPAVPSEQRLFIKNYFGLLHTAITNHDHVQMEFLFRALKNYQRDIAGESMPSPAKIRTEILYNRINFSSVLFKGNLTAGILALLYFILTLFGKLQRTSLIRKLFLGYLIIAFIFHSGGLILRSVISGHLPMSNGFETMLFVSGCIMLITLLFQRRIPLLMPSGLLLSGFTLLVAHISSMNPQITPLVPVLNSPLLSLHVSVIMFSYALFAFLFLNGILSISLYYIQKRNHPYIAVKHLLQLTLVSRIFLYPAVFLLGTGIFIGAIWANISWGTYWSWDPKEVWALITFMMYGLALHFPINGKSGKPIRFHLFLILAFGTVLMTYFGVNFLLGGMHSYGG